jgi:hypothetical protein
MDVVQYVHADVPLCHPADLIPHYTHHRHIHVDVHSEDSVRKKKITVLVKISAIKFHENLYVGNLVTLHVKRNKSIDPL